MIDGRFCTCAGQVILMDIETARQLLLAFHPVSRENLERLQELGVLEAVEALRSTVRAIEADGEPEYYEL